MLKLYGHFLSSPTNKVRFCLARLGLPHDYIHVDLAKGEQMGDDYLEINPHGRVPAIDDDGFRLSQSDAICTYLCAISGPSSFYPAEAQAQAIINQWRDFASLHVLPALGRIFYNRVVAPMIGERPNEDFTKSGEDMLARDLPYIEAQLAKTRYIAGNNLTLADTTMIAALEPAEMCQFDLSPYTEIQAWRERIMGKEFYRKVHTHFGAEMAAMNKDG
ncbi:MAG TPA: glutathione S-transferase family protein [Hellea balneolensis]|uniref:Glutathione S-transferase family protein n=1 Tax=Hellea balneolensis TaxID=287478 RepID=A0A7V5U1C8_9PROT|nr:glutathione S-transferase family protein [Hellea balneolensis]